VHRVQQARSERYASLRGYFHGMDDAADESLGRERKANTERRARFAAAAEAAAQ
jgi:hypothetical protein